jgi:hypothetical protein
MQHKRPARIHCLTIARSKTNRFYNDATTPVRSVKTIENSPKTYINAVLVKKVSKNQRTTRK